jgi:hypothetical protein
MTTRALLKRLNELAPPLRPTPHEELSPLALAAMKAYLAGQPLTFPGVSPEVLRAANEFLAGNGPPFEKDPHLSDEAKQEMRDFLANDPEGLAPW